MSDVPFRARSGLLLVGPLLLLLVGVGIRGKLFSVSSERLLDISIMVDIWRGETRDEACSARAEKMSPSYYEE
jgi:hypothetical protein